MAQDDLIEIVYLLGGLKGAMEQVTEDHADNLPACFVFQNFINRADVQLAKLKAHIKDGPHV